MKIIKKPWGYESIFANTKLYIGKYIYINKRKRLSLQYHEMKDETMILTKGKARLTINDETFDWEIGKSYHITPGTIHRIEAIEDCEVTEVSTAYPDDVIRIADDFNRIKEIMPKLQK